MHRYIRQNQIQFSKPVGAILDTQKIMPRLRLGLPQVARVIKLCHILCCFGEDGRRSFKLFPQQKVSDKIKFQNASKRQIKIIYFYVIKTPLYTIIAGDSQTHIISNLALWQRVCDANYGRISPNRITKILKYFLSNIRIHGLAIGWLWFINRLLLWTSW